MQKLLTVVCVLAVIVSACATIDADKPEVHVIGVYEGSYPQNAGHGSRTPYQIDISVRERHVPVVLVLMSHEPVDWRFTLDEGARVKEVILSSVHPGHIKGLDREVPVLRESLGIAYRRDAAYEKLRKYLLERYGSEPASFQYGYKGREFSIN